MKLIEALKQCKLLKLKAQDLREKIKNNCALTSLDTSPYGDTKAATGKISEWLQAHFDILQRIAHLQTSIQHTNLVTKVTVELDGKPVVKSIAEWILRRRDLSKLDLEAWYSLTDRGLKEGYLQTIKNDPNAAPVTIKVIRFFDAEERDRKISSFREEPTLIDQALEIANATLDLIEA